MDGYDKPRRLEPDTVAYITSLKPSLSSLLTPSNETDPASATLLVDNVMDELKHRLASAAADKSTHDAIEILCQLADLNQLLRIAQRLTPYAQFLASNRHASHILQTTLTRIAVRIRGGEDHSSLSSTVLDLVRPLTRYVSSLAADTCASHVIRSILLLLSGLPIVAERKSKASKHKHCSSPTVTLESLLDPLSCISDKHFIQVPQSWLDEVIATASSLASLPQSDLLSVCVNSSGCVVLALLLRLLNQSIFPSAPDIVLAITSKSLGIHLDSCADTVYGLAGEKGGSHFLQAALEVITAPYFKSIVRVAVLGRAFEYAEDGSGNFVLQTILRRLGRDKDGDVGVQLARELVGGNRGGDNRGGDNNVGGGIDEAALGRLLRHRAGVVWSTLCCLASIRSSDTQTTTADWFELTAAGVLSCWAAASRDLSTALADILRDDVTADRFDSSRTSIASGRIMHVIVSEGGRSSESLVAAISFMPSEELRRIAEHGQLSRLIIDPILECADVSSVSLLRITHSLVQCAADLAAHYVGQHVLRKLYARAGLSEKELLVSRIAGARDKLARSKEGRASMLMVHEDAYSKDSSTWRKQLERGRDIIGGAGPRGARKQEDAATAVSADAENEADNDRNDRNDDNDDDNDDNGLKTSQLVKRKRKRRRVKGNNT